MQMQRWDHSVFNPSSEPHIGGGVGNHGVGKWTLTPDCLDRLISSITPILLLQPDLLSLHHWLSPSLVSLVFIFHDYFQLLNTSLDPVSPQVTTSYLALFLPSTSVKEESAFSPLTSSALSNTRWILPHYCAEPWISVSQMAS